MLERKKTLIFAGAALLLLVLAILTAPRTKTPDAFLDQGELFFPNFTDPNSATSLEVIDYDAETGEALPFKVLFADGKWTIPSHHDYPADGKDMESLIKCADVAMFRAKKTGGIYKFYKKPEDDDKGI